MRINPNISANLLAALNRLSRQQDLALSQISSGRRIKAPSGDPNAAVASVQIQVGKKETDQFLNNLATLRGMTEVAESNLSSVINTLTRAIVLGVQGANDTLSPSNRQSLAIEVRGLKDQLINLANLGTFRGAFVFSGTAVTTRAFVLDSGQPSGVRYDGDSGVSQVEIASGQFIQINVPGDQVFMEPGKDVFLGVEQLATALENDDSAAMAVALDNIKIAFDHINDTRAFYGTTLRRLENAESFLNQSKLSLARQENDILGVDLAESIINLVQAQTTRDAVISAGARLNAGRSLIDFLG